jgi:hypothetical protein
MSPAPEAHIDSCLIHSAPMICANREVFGGLSSLALLLALGVVTCRKVARSAEMMAQDWRTCHSASCPHVPQIPYSPGF